MRWNYPNNNMYLTSRLSHLWLMFIWGSKTWFDLIGDPCVDFLEMWYTSHVGFLDILIVHLVDIVQRWMGWLLAGWVGLLIHELDEQFTVRWALTILLHSLGLVQLCHMDSVFDHLMAATCLRSTLTGVWIPICCNGYAVIVFLSFSLSLLGVS